ncbi:ABC transporter ATP-binding protein [Desulfotomaculum defluvii]
MEPVLKATDIVQVVNKKTVLGGISLELKAGEALGIFGTRGSGKTTLLHLLAGIEKYKSGSVEILGVDTRKGDTYKKHLGLVTQERSLFQELRVVENLDFIATLRGGSRVTIEKLVEQLELKDILREPVATLEHGLYQRLALACALLNEPELLIADELIRDIDFYSRKLIIKTVRQFLQGGGAFLCGFSHPDYVNQLDRVGWLTEGQLTFYQPEEAAAQWQRLFVASNLQSGEIND